MTTVKVFKDENRVVVTSQGSQGPRGAAGESSLAELANTFVFAGDGLSGGGALSDNVTFTVDGTVVRTSGDQTIGGNKRFGSTLFVDQTNAVVSINSVNILANDYATLLSARSNDFATYTVLRGMIDTVQSNVGGGAAAANANDYATYITLQSEYRANDVVTLLSARANDYSTYTTLQGELRSNDYATYTALQSELRANDVATLLSARANDYATLLSARANDYATYTALQSELRANDYATYTTLQSELRANDYATWSGLNAFTSIKANSSVNILAGSGLSGGGPLTGNVTVAVDSTVVRTSGDQTIGGDKTFSEDIVISGNLTVLGNTVSVNTTSLLVRDKFIELGANTVGVPAGDVGIYLNRGSFGNSAIYYNQAGGYFAIAETNDPATNTSVSPTSFANLRVKHLRVDSTDLVTNLNADLLDGQSGAYYTDFANASNTNYITLAYVTANGAVTTDSISVGGLAVDGDTLYVDIANDRVGVNTLTPAAEFQVSNVGLSTSIVVTSATSAYILDSLPIAAFRTAKYLVQAHDTVSNQYQTSEVLLIHNNSTAFITEYAIIYTNDSLGSITANIASGSARLIATPASANNTIFKTYRQALTI